MVKLRTQKKVANFDIDSTSEGNAGKAYNRLARLNPADKEKAISLFRQKASVCTNLQFTSYSAFRDALKTINIDDLTKEIPQSISKSLSKASEQVLAKYNSNWDVIKDLYLRPALEEAKSFAGNLYKRMSQPLYRRLYTAKVPAEYRTMLTKLKKFQTKEEYVQASYNELKKTLGISGTADGKITVLKPKGFFGDIFATDLVGGYNFVENKIFFESQFYRLSKPEQTAMIGHEMMHARQVEGIIRTFGIEKYIQALESNGGKLSSKERETLLTNFANIIKKPCFSPNSPEGLKAAKDLEALSIYKGIARDSNGKLSVADGYLQNGLEKEAYKFQRQLQKWAQLSEQVS